MKKEDKKTDKQLMEEEEYKEYAKYDKTVNERNVESAVFLVCILLLIVFGFNYYYMDMYNDNLKEDYVTLMTTHYELVVEHNALSEKYNKQSFINITNYETINHSEVSTILRSKFKDLKVISIKDSEYKLYNIIETMSVTSFISETKYVNESNDCDDYAIKYMAHILDNLRSNAVGYIIVATNDSFHAVNIVIDSDKNVWVLEPQYNKYVLYEEYEHQELRTVFI